jgi:hypothetical protein
MQFMYLLYAENNMLISDLFIVSGMGKLRDSGGERSPGSCTKKSGGERSPGSCTKKMNLLISGQQFVH